jgi:hypothetical protein
MIRLWNVTPGLDPGGPAIKDVLAKKLDCRIKSGNDKR